MNWKKHKLPLMLMLAIITYSCASMGTPDGDKEPALHWNSTIVNLMELEKRKLPCDDPTVVELELDRIEDEVANFVEKLERITNLLKRLCSKQLITSLTVTPSSFRYTYKNPDVRECLQKSGNALELITYYAAMSIMNGDQPLINDGAVGVFIDWDGVMHTSDDEEKDTRNEMDLILMRGLVPIFVSCKNGSVQENELYKLNTVAMRFGNVHALKVLVVGSMNDNDTGVRYFKQRAADMGITVIDGVRSLSSLEFAEELRKAFIK